MKRIFSFSHCVLALGMLGIGCGSEPPMMEAAPPGTAIQPAGAQPPAAPGPCVLPSDCVDINTLFFASKACCTPTTTCGYELPELDSETLMHFPDAKEFIAKQTAGDPNGRCAPASFFLGPRPGLYKHRVEPENGQDILITPDCGSFTVLAFILPGCCLPDNTCGLSTDESYSTLEVLAGAPAPFTSPECVSAPTLNQQFRDSMTLAPFARTIASGACNYAALAAELPKQL
jgi:hypothetical protein